jgi:thioredoxin reductase (NADPH)
MNLPIIFSIDDDPQVLRAITRDLRSNFRNEYRILSTTSVKEALDSLLDLKNKSEVIALFISDQRMPEMEGVDFLQKAREFFPDAKRVLLTAYSDTEAAIKAINDVQLDYPGTLRKKNSSRSWTNCSTTGRRLTALRSKA